MAQDRRRGPARKAVAFVVAPDVFAWLERVASEAGDADADHAACALLSRLCAEDRAEELGA